MSNTSSKFILNSFQYSNFDFIHFSHLSSRFIQLSHFCQLLLNFLEKINLENTIQSLIEFF